MFEALELGQTLPKAEFKQRESHIRADLLQLQQELKEANIATLIIVAGVEGAGKGDVVNRLNKWLDSRGIETHAFWDETDEELQRPADWRFWRRLPSRGQIAIMFGGWYWEPIYQFAHHQIDESELDEAARRVKEIERMLQQDGLLVIKLWFHLSYKTHKKYIKKRSDNEHDIPYADGKESTLERYQNFLASAERMIRFTDTGDNPWDLIEANDKWFRDMSVSKILSRQIERRLTEHRNMQRRSILHDQEIKVDAHPVTVLDKLDLSVTLSREEYDEQLSFYKEKLHQLSWDAYKAHRSTVIMLEGWDAAGKGGAIRRLTSAIDARLFRVISVAAPTDEELAHHYLWRFWRQIPRDGYMTFYDRSWYGRVLVERVEKYARNDEWMRAYQEINDFEEQLTGHGTLVLKFWLHISPEEQLNRFKEREQIEWKKHKITEDDWRNRDKWDDYKQAVNTMVMHTSTGNAAWHLVPANNKFHARIHVIKTVCEHLEQALSE
ncbi:MAG: polyphosphate:AMP phosphotransferase [Gammaproteobacteria bacterium]|nr:polyphosphate:AMP phosphotransferase [Gammaproteobacteria bacterium]